MKGLVKAGLIVLVLAIASCSKKSNEFVGGSSATTDNSEVNTDTPLESKISLVSGGNDDQKGLVNKPLAKPFIVKAFIEGGSAPNIKIDWKIVTGNGSFSGEKTKRTITDKNGLVQGVLTLGSSAANSVKACLVDDDTVCVKFSATGVGMGSSNTGGSNNNNGGGSGGGSGLNLLSGTPVDQLFQRYGTAAAHITLPTALAAEKAFRIRAQSVTPISGFAAAIAGKDYVDTDYMLTVPQGASSFNIAVPLIFQYKEDALNRPAVHFEVKIEETSSSTNTTYAPLTVDLKVAAGLVATPILATKMEHSLEEDFACVLGIDSNLLCMGENANGQLGIDPSDENKIQSWTRVDFGGSGADPIVVDFSAGGNNNSGVTCAVVKPAGGTVNDQTVKCLGSNSEHLLGSGFGGSESFIPVDIGLSAVTAVGVGSNYACAILSDKTVWCWGDVTTGSLVQVSGLSAAKSISVALPRVCALTDSGDVYCWGKDASPSVITPIISGVAKLSARDQNMCVILTGGAVSCWGYNNHLQLGPDSTLNVNSTTPIEIKLAAGMAAASQNAVDIAVGLDSQICSIQQSGAVLCWGNIKNEDKAVPINMGISGATALYPGNQESICYLKQDQKIQCIGDGTLQSIKNSHIPIVAAESGIQAIASGYFGYGNCFVSDGKVYCKGRNSAGELGQDPNVMSYSDSFIEVVLAHAAIQVAQSPGSYCALLENGQVQCWGDNSSGQLGNSSVVAAYSYTPVTVALTGVSPAAVDLIGSGIGTFCALLEDGTAQCWGNSGTGILGPLDNGSSNGPLSVAFTDGNSNPLKAKKLSVHILSGSIAALMEDGTVQNWGMGAGTPVDVGFSQVIDISMGGGHQCAVMEDGTVACFGTNSEGQLGNNSTTDSSSPVAVQGLLKPVVKVVAGYSSSCAILQTGQIQCWGAKNYGGAANGEPKMYYSLVDSTNSVDLQAGDPVLSISTAVSLISGYANTCAILADKSAYCWGLIMYNPFISPVDLPFLTKITQ